jgi:chloramphenicol-sensitive protein RarD
LALTLTLQRRWDWFKLVLQDRRTLITFIAAALLLSVNWLTYIWSIVHEQLVASTLGYFMNPLVNVLLGIIFLREKLRFGQLSAIAIAALGVCYLAIHDGAVLWVSLTLAFSFSGYALLRKIGRLDSLQGLTLETMVLLLPSLGYLGYLEGQGLGQWGHTDWGTTFLLIGAGLITAVPLLLFAAGARRISLSTLGLLQYISTTIQLLIAVYLFGEPLTPTRLVSFCLIWLALAVYSIEGLLIQQRRIAPSYPTASTPVLKLRSS